MSKLHNQQLKITSIDETKVGAENSRGWGIVIYIAEFTVSCISKLGKLFKVGDTVTVKNTDSGIDFEK